MKLSFSELTKYQTNILKGFAMLCLVLHNFLHWTNGIKENEMSLDPNRIYVLFNSIIHGDVSFINGIFSYFGFYFIEIFIFISGYGLAKQYSKSRSISYFRFVIPKLIKIYSLLIFGIVLYFLVFYNVIAIKSIKSFVCSNLFFYNNFTFDKIWQNEYVGPWWYFGLVVQLYLIFPFLYKFLDKFKEKGFFVLMLFSFVLISILYPITNKLGIVLFASCIGHLPEFLLGIGIALFQRFAINLRIILLSLIIFILSNFFECFYPFTFFTATILLLTMMYPLLFIENVRVKNIFVFLGSISMFMFLINGPLRFFTIPYTEEQSSFGILFYSLVHLIIVIFVSYIISIFYNKLILPITKRIINILC